MVPLPVRFPPWNCRGFELFADRIPPFNVVTPAVCVKALKKDSVAALANTLPEFLNRVVTWLFVVPPVFSKIPPVRLLKVAAVPPLKVTNASSWRFQVAELLTTAPFSIRNDRPLPPLPNVTLAGVFSTPPFRTTPPALGNAIPPEAVVVPARFNAPAVQLNNPATFSVLAVPESVPPVRVNGPAIVTGLGWLKFTVPEGTFVVPVTV